MSDTTRDRRAEIIQAGWRRVAKHVAEQYRQRLNTPPNRSESPIEELMEAALLALVWNKGEFFRFSQQVSAGDYRVDFLLDYTDPLVSGTYVASVAIECDGHDFHEKTKEQAKRDKERDRKLLAMDLPTLRFTGSEIYADPFKCSLEAMRQVQKLYYQRVYGPSRMAQ